MHFAVVVVEYDIAVVIRVVCTCCVDAVSGVVCFYRCVVVVVVAVVNLC